MCFLPSIFDFNVDEWNVWMLFSLSHGVLSRWFLMEEANTHSHTHAHRCKMLEHTNTYMEASTKSCVYIYAMIVYFVSLRVLYSITTFVSNYIHVRMCSGEYFLALCCFHFSPLRQLFELILRRHGNTKSVVNATVNSFNARLLSKGNQFWIPGINAFN